MRKHYQFRSNLFHDNEDLSSLMFENIELTREVFFLDCDLRDTVWANCIINARWQDNWFYGSRFVDCTIFKSKQRHPFRHVEFEDCVFHSPKGTWENCTVRGTLFTSPPIPACDEKNASSIRAYDCTFKGCVFDGILFNRPSHEPNMGMDDTEFEDCIFRNGGFLRGRLWGCTFENCVFENWDFFLYDTSSKLYPPPKFTNCIFRSCKMTEFEPDAPCFVGCTFEDHNRGNWNEVFEYVMPSVWKIVKKNGGIHRCGEAPYEYLVKIHQSLVERFGEFDTKRVWMLVGKELD